MLISLALTISVCRFFNGLFLSTSLKEGRGWINLSNSMHLCVVHLHEGKTPKSTSFVDNLFRISKIGSSLAHYVMLKKNKIVQLLVGEQIFFLFFFKTLAKRKALQLFISTYQLQTGEIQRGPSTSIFISLAHFLIQAVSFKQVYLVIKLLQEGNTSTKGFAVLSLCLGQTFNL